MTRREIEHWTDYTWKNTNNEECIIPGYQLVDLLNFWQENGEKCKILLDGYNLWKGLK